MREMDATNCEAVNVTLLKIPEVAKVLRVSKATAYRMRQNGELPAIKIGGQWRVPEAALIQMLTLTTSPAA